MSDFITVLTTASGADLGKSFSGPDLQPLPFQTSKHFTTEELEVHDLSSLMDVLQSLEGETTKTVIRGKVLSDASEIISRDKETIVASPRSWCMIDIDGLFWDGPNDHEAMLNHAISHLPVEFHNTDCYYHFSSSMGIKDGIRVHIWYWLDRQCSDEEMKVWLSGTGADPRMYNPIQIHLTANPRFVEGAVDPVAKRSGVLAFGDHKQTVSVPDDLADRTISKTQTSRYRKSGASGALDTNGIVRDEQTGLVIDGREAFMFLLSNQVMRDLVTVQSHPTEDEITAELWKRFVNEADVSVVSDRGQWTIQDARIKAKARLQELTSGTFDFVSRSDKTTLVPHRTAEQRPELVSAMTAKSQLNDVLTDFFDRLAQGQGPRSTVRITMGTGKTTETIHHLKAYLSDKFSLNIEVYVPRHDLADEWCDKLSGVNARLVHVRPRTGGKINPTTVGYDHQVLCDRADYVRDLEQKGHSIYGTACLSRITGEQCKFFNDCAYLNQFRSNPEQTGLENTIRIYTHTSLFLSRNEYERERQPDLVIIDETFLQAAVGNLPSVSTNDIIQHLRFDGNPSLGFDLVECLTNQNGDLSYLRNKDIGPFELQSISLEALNPNTEYDPGCVHSRNVRSAKRYKALSQIVDIASRELADDSLTHFGQLAYNPKSQEVVVCEHRPMRVGPTTPVLYLDATADPIITEAYLPNTQLHRIDVHQLAVVSQVYDRTGSNTFWSSKVDAEVQNLANTSYDPDNNDLSSLTMVLNEWVEAGEKPLLVSHKALHDHLRSHPHIHQEADLAYFNALRGLNTYEDNSAIFITGRNQPPLDDIERQARVVFGASGIPLHFDDPDHRPTEEIGYWLSARSPHPPSGVSVSSFSDPRIAAIQKQIREAETVQAIARLRLVWAKYQKRVFLLSNLPVEMPVDHLIEFGDLIPDRLEIELMKNGNVPLTAKGWANMCSNADLSIHAITKLVQRSKAHDPKQLIAMLPSLLRTTAQLATFKAGKVRKTTHQHLFLPKNYSGNPTTSTFTPWTEEEIREHLTTGWQDEAITDLEVRFLFEGTPEVSG